MRKLTLLATAIALSASASAFAITAQTGVYAQAVGGWANAAKPGMGVMQSTDLINKSYALGGNIGYDYAFNQNVMAGLEAGYLNLGTSTYEYPTSAAGSYAKTNNWGYQVLATGTYLASNGLNAFVKGGTIDERSIQSYTYGYPGAGTSYYTPATQERWIPAAAVGVGYMPTQNINIALQYEHTFGSTWGNVFPSDLAATYLVSPSKPMSLDIFTLSASYKFAM
jgi:opacity protein-like surface antigen